jgi:hypothetical protein
MGSVEGRGLFLGSNVCPWLVTRVVCEDVGVACADPAGEWFAELPNEGEELPVAGSPFFFEDLLDSLPVARESCCGG